MQYEIKDDRLLIDGHPVRFVPSPNQGGRIEPTGVLYHDTADRLVPEDSVNWFRNAKSKVSAHFVVGRDGSIVQMVDCDRAAWHAGKSSWQGRSGCNGFMIGIEIDNPGRLTPRGDKAVAWFGEAWAADECHMTDSSCRDHGVGAWLPYTETQLAAVEALTRALVAAYPSIKSAAGHYEVSPGRKVDPGPHFPMPRMRAALGNRRPADTRTVEDLQGSLAALGYPVGDVDGIIGVRTRAAIRAFQEQNSVPITGEFDAATLMVIASGNAKEMPLGHREAVTQDDLAAQGSEAVKSALLTKRSAEVGVAVVLGVAGSGGDAPPAATMEALPSPEAIITAAEQHRSLGDRLLSLIDWTFTARGFTTLVVLAALLTVWAVANNQGVRRVLKARLGIA